MGEETAKWLFDNFSREMGGEGTFDLDDRR